ncbi:MAG: hypothetical protein OXL96_16540 [Candidatus Poribacteria bacterium]|nr:hypothetical protein [Candidatus Poribacteria bacterium]
MKKLLFLVPLFVIGLVFTGCPEAKQMMAPVVTDEPVEEESTPVITGGMKQPDKPEASDERPEDEAEKSAEPEKSKELAPPADTTPPTVVEVGWYSDWQMTQPLTADSAVRPGDTIYTTVVFSEAMQHTIAEDETASPAMFVVLSDRETQYHIKWHTAVGVDFASGDAKPIHNTATDVYICKYTVSEEYSGPFGIKVTGVSEPFEHTAPFTIEENGVTPTPNLTEQPRTTLVEVGSEYTFTIEGETYPGYNPSPKLQHILDTHPSAELPHFTEAVKMVEVIDWAYRKSGELYFPHDWERLITVRREVEAQFGLTKVVQNTLDQIYTDFLGYEPDSLYWSGVEQIRILLQNPEPLKTEMTAEGMADIQRRFRESLENGLIVGQTNPNN